MKFLGNNRATRSLRIAECQQRKYDSLKLRYVMNASLIQREESRAEVRGAIRRTRRVHRTRCVGLSPESALPPLSLPNATCNWPGSGGGGVNEGGGERSSGSALFPQSYTSGTTGHDRSRSILRTRVSLRTWLLAPSWHPFATPLRPFAAPSVHVLRNARPRLWLFLGDELFSPQVLPLASCKISPTVTSNATKASMYFTVPISFAIVDVGNALIAESLFSQLLASFPHQRLAQYEEHCKYLYIRIEQQSVEFAGLAQHSAPIFYIRGLTDSFIETV
jgi:hypothetical protein